MVSAEPVEVTFHRKWAGNRVFTARPVADGKPYIPAGDVLALAWTERDGGRYVRHPVFTRDGTVTVEFNDGGVSLLLVDRRRRVSGFVSTAGDAAELDLPLRPVATYSGTLVDQSDGQPIADRDVGLMTDPSFLDVVEPQRTDELGRFEFENVPAGVPLKLAIDVGTGRRFPPDCERRFESGERKSGDVVNAEFLDGDAAPRQPAEVSIAKRTAGAAENCRVTGMRVIAVLEGDDSKRVRHLAGRLANGDEVGAIYRYLPVAVTALELTKNAGELAALQWPKPAAGEVMLVAMTDGNGASAAVRLETADLESAFRRGVEFIEQHAPPVCDGRQRLEEAKSEAGKSHRTIWLIIGGSRCGPCFLLARWIDRHHDVLEKDLVIVKLTNGLDTYTNEIKEQIGGAEEGFPFHALLSPDGDVLISSKGPVGNIGMPDDEGVEHFQTMLETAQRNMTIAEVNELIDSLKEE